MGTAIIVILLLALCGFIAYIGDLLGRRLGKKRLSVFGLRPKHTAVLLTVVTGVVIALFTFTVAMAAVPWFRRAVTEGEKLAVQNERFRHNNEDLAKRSVDLKHQNEGLHRENARLEAASQELLQTNTDLKKANVTLGWQSEVLKDQNTRLQGSNVALSAANLRLRGTNESLTRQSRELTTQNRTLRQASARLQTANDELRAAKVRTLYENARLARENGDLREAREKLSEYVKSLSETAADYEAGQFIFRRGQEIEREIIPPNPPVKVLRDTVDRLLFSAQHRAQIRNPRLPQGTPALTPVPPRGFPKKYGRWNEITDWVVRNAAAVKGKPLLLRIVTSTNCVAGRTVPARLEWFPNDPVFKKGELIAERAVDGGAAEWLIYLDLLHFHRNQVRTAADQRSITPANDEGVVDTTLEHLFAVTQKIKALGSLTRVQAKARHDTNRAGPLYVDLDVEPINVLPADAR